MQSKFKIALFFPIALVIGIGLKFLLPKPQSNDAFEEYCWVKKTHSTEKHNILAIGDSRIYKGVNPDILIEGTSNLSAFNYGFLSAGYSQEYLDFISTRIVKDGKKIVLCGITPHSFTLEPLKNEHYHSFLDKNNQDVYKILYLSKYLQSFPRFSPSEIYDHFMETPVTHLYYHEYKENGWVKAFKIPFDSTYALTSYRDVFQSNVCDKNAIANYLEWVKERTSKGVEIVGFRPPTTLAMEQLEDSLSGFDYSQFVTKFEDNGGHWFTYSISDYRSYDGSHMHYESAELFTRNLKEYISQFFE